MALFPAYAEHSTNDNDYIPKEATVFEDIPTEISERLLLASDSEDEKSCQNLSEPPRKLPRSDSSLKEDSNFYLDYKLDRGNLRVSTLYYPSRPYYDYNSYANVGEGKKRHESRARRYYARRPSEEPESVAVTERIMAYRRLLAESPHDVTLWERFINFQEACGGAEGALTAAREGLARVPTSRRLLTRLLQALRTALPLHDCIARLRDMLSEEKSVSVRTELWERLLCALAMAPETDAGQLTEATRAAFHDTRSWSYAYPRLLYVLGSYLRTAGLSERLVLLVELVAAMNLAPSASSANSAPPTQVELRLQDLEDKATTSGLPLSAVWVRVERARGTAHWRPVPDAGDVIVHSADPQRAPLPHDVADLLLPVAAEDDLLHLSVRLLMLAKIPILPGTEWTSLWAGSAAQTADTAEALLPLLTVSLTLPSAHPARISPTAARRMLLLLLEPPHYFTDEVGYLSWVNELWEMCLERAQGEGRVALLCWRLRWLRALLLLADGADGAAAERTRLRVEARAALRRWAGEASLPFAEFARIEASAAGRERAAHVAAQALRAACADSACPPHHRIYVARILCEVQCGWSSECACALVCAVLGRELPPRLTAPSPADIAEALQRCEQQCDEIEAELTDERDEGDVWRTATALLPGQGEWASARALLAPPSRRALLLRRLAVNAPGAENPNAMRYWSEQARALAECAAHEGRSAAVARFLAPLFPHDAYLALACAGAPLWAWETAQIGEARLRALAPVTDVSALASILPALARAIEKDFPPQESEALVRVSRRATRGSTAGPLLWTARLESEARAPNPRLQHALYAALDAAPHAKWLYVRGAAWCGGEAAALADALLERQLRLHALPDELRATTMVIEEATPTTTKRHD